MVAAFARALARPRLWLGLGAMLLLLGLGALALMVATDSFVSMPRVAARLAEAEAAGALGDEKGEHHAFGFVLSRFSECIGLSVAASGVEGEPGFTLRSRAVLWQPGSNICDKAVAAVADPGAVRWFDYARYWHGYRVVVFPLVAAFGIDGAGLILTAGSVAAAGLLVLALLPVAGPAFGLLSFGIVLVLTGLPFAAVTPTHAVSLGMLFLATALIWRWGLEGSLERRILAAAAAGMAYNFVDFLYHPGALAMLVGGMAVIDAARRGRAMAPAAVLGSGLGLAVLGGYAAFWVLKWLLDLPLWLWGGADFPILPGDFGRWSAGHVPPFAATAALVAVTVNEPLRLLIAAASALILIVAGAWSVGARSVMAALLAPVAVGLLTIEAASSHSLAHAAFTFRIVPLALALLALGAGTGLRTGRRRRSAARWPAGARPDRSGAAPPAPPRADWRSAGRPAG